MDIDEDQLPPTSSPARANNNPNNSDAPVSPPQQQNQTAAAHADPMSSPSQRPHDSYIYGTTLRIGKLETTLRQFLVTYKEPNKTKPKYMNALRIISLNQSTHLSIDAQDVYAYSPIFYSQIVQYPSEILPLIDTMVNNIYDEEFAEPLPGPIEVHLFNLLHSKPMRDLNPSDIEQLISVTGMVTRVSEIIPEIMQGHFKCATCGEIEIAHINKGRIEEPNKCRECATDRSMVLIHNRCLFNNKQVIKLQETPESIPEGETPHTVSLMIFGQLVDTVKPGDRVDVTGIYRAVPQRMVQGKRTLNTLFKSYIDGVHFRRSGVRIASDGDVGQEHFALPDDDEETNVQDEEASQTYASNVNISKDEERQILNLAKSPDVYERLTKAIAPEIWQMDDVKKGILCQLFGGTHKKFANGKIRGEINILLVGDPGVSKSQLLLYVHKIAPRGIYTSGKGSSAVGLTAYVTKDPDSGDFVLESGALVLSDLGVCCIDEFDKMSDSARSILHEVMEQQTVSVAKAGIICSLNARTSILAAANPKESKYNDALSIVDNIQLPPTLLSRFDLIYLLRDGADKVKDANLAKHIISLYYAKPEVESTIIDTKTLTKYISYAKKRIHPIISDAAKEQLIEGYLELRRLGNHRKQITATTRQLESLIRIAEGLARMRFSTNVEVKDVAEALRLVRASIFKAAVDPRSGQVDIDLLTTGFNREQREEMQNTADTEPSQTLE